MDSRLRIGFVLVITACILGLPSSGQSQLLYREREGYRNYGEEGYRNYGRSFFVQLTQPVFDELGGFVMDGIEVFRLEEYETRAPVPSSVIDKAGVYQGYLRRLIVSADSYKGRSWSLIVGDRIRTKFSALTMDMAALNGVRVDLDLPTQKWSFVGSRLDRPIYTNADNEQHLRPEHAPLFSTYLLGGHWETKIGILKLGASYVNQFRVNSLVSPERNSLSGVIPNRVQAVEYLVVKVADGSPRDRSGPRVYDMRLHLNGEPSGILPQITRHNEQVVDYTYPEHDRYYPSDRHIPPFVQFIRGDFPILRFPEQGFLQISGYDVLLFWFPIPAGQEIRSATFEAWVANDYAIHVAEVFVQNEGASRNLPADRNRASFFYEVAYAKGNVKDRSNVRRVRFRYGRQTANTVGGVYARAEAKGIHFRAEFARSFDFRQFPDPEAHKTVTKADAYFVNLSRDSGPFRIGAEVFDISPEYSTTFAVQDPKYSSFSDIPFAPLAGAINAPTGTLDEAQNNTLFFNTVDDNDDKDPYPDDHFLSFIRDRNGVFPGLDEDYDRRPDLNRNSNLIPDYMEPFLLYEVNPEPYDYGDDMNNNGAIDVRENDRKPDYPYDRDLKGYHVYADVYPEGTFRLRLGRVRTEQEAGGGISRAWYLKAEYTRRRPKVGEIQWIHFVKRVRDTIPDDVFRFPLDVRIPVERFEDRVASLGLVQQFVEDPLRMSDSLVNTSYLSLRAFPLEGWTVGGSLKVDVNMRERSRPDRRSTLTDWAMVGKTSYRRRVGKLTVEPQFKVLFEDQRDSKERTFPLRELYVYPILRLEHPLGGSTRLKVGAQGFPFFKSLYRDFAREGRDYDSQDYMVMLTNRTDYLGYEVALNLGYHIRKQHYDNPERSFEGEDFTLFFARAVVSTGQRTRSE